MIQLKLSNPVTLTVTFTLRQLVLIATCAMSMLGAPNWAIVNAPDALPKGTYLERQILFEEDTNTNKVPLHST